MLNTRFFDDFNAMRRDMDRIFSALDSSEGRALSWSAAPAVETGWTDDYLNLRFVLPGVPEDSLDISVQGNQLVIRGERPTPQGFGKQGATHYRLPYGKFERTVDLPSGLDTDKCEANLHHGLLDLRFPVSEAVKPRRIEIQSEPKAAKKIAA
ncbi:MAG: Hsp20/alpha crystallin family protein [Bryobacterales bacterium]